MTFKNLFCTFCHCSELLLLTIDPHREKKRERETMEENKNTSSVCFGFYFSIGIVAMVCFFFFLFLIRVIFPNDSVNSLVEYCVHIFQLFA